MTLLSRKFSAHLPLWGALLAAAALYSLYDFPATRLAGATYAAWALPYLLSRRQTGVGLGLALAAGYAAAFLLNPLALALAATAGRPPQTGQLLQLLLAGGGAAWVGFWIWRPARAALRPLLPSPGDAAILTVGLLCFHLAPALADLAYAGDECFHVTTIQWCQSLWLKLLENSTWTRFGQAWLAGGAALAGGGLIFRRRPRAAGSAGETQVGRSIFWLWLTAGLGLAAAAPFFLPQTETLGEFGLGRAARYPATQPWLSVLLGQLCREQWNSPGFYRLEVARLLPLLAAFGAILILAGDPRWRSESRLRRLTAVAALATTPLLLFFGTVQCLEMAAVPLLLPLLFDARHWLLAAPARLRQRPASLAAPLLGLTTDVAAVALLTLYATRLAAQRRRLLSRVGLTAELRLAFQLALPAILFIAVRFYAQRYAVQLLGGVVPYTGAGGNLLDWRLWQINLEQAARQFGLLLPAAAAGAWLAWRGGRRPTAILSGGLFLVMGILYMTYVPETIGLARHNLLLLPPLMTLSWELLTALKHRRLPGGLLIAGLLGANLLLNRGTPDGDRQPWPGMGEQWYNYREAFTAIKQVNPHARVMLVNMPHGYAHWWLAHALGWKPKAILQYRPFAPDNPELNLKLSLAEGARNQADFVIYRRERDQRLPEQAGAFGFAELARFPSLSGELVLYGRAAGR